MTTADWRAANRANWDERVPVHLNAPGYDPGPLRAGRRRLDPIVETELGPVEGLSVLHLQCHFGLDTLALAQRGATVVGLDFSALAIAAARAMADELGLAGRARFVEADLYDAPLAVPEPHAFDRVFTTWGTVTWLPDIRAWARVVAGFLKPGGALYYADAHPAAQVFDDLTPLPDGRPGYFVPYFQREPVVLDDPSDYADASARLRHARQYNWMHPVASIVTALIDAGLRLDFLHEHDAVAWRMFKALVAGADGLYRWPDKPWLPLALSLRAVRPRA